LGLGWNEPRSPVCPPPHTHTQINSPAQTWAACSAHIGGPHGSGCTHHRCQRAERSPTHPLPPKSAKVTRRATQLEGAQRGGWRTAGKGGGGMGGGRSCISTRSRPATYAHPSPNPSHRAPEACPGAALPDARIAWLRLLEHCVLGQGHPRLSGACKWGITRVVACARTAHPRDPPPHGLETPHPTPAGARWSAQPERARPCMHARMLSRRCAAAARRKEAAHGLRQASQWMKAVRPLRRNASSSTGTVSNRRWGGAVARQGTRAPSQS
jgi:hypothetical protein